MQNLLNFTYEELEGFIISIGEAKFRAKQIYDWLHKKRVNDFEQITNISAQLKEKLKNNFCIKSKMFLIFIYHF